uniref:Zinc finger protein 36, C3H type-like 1 n=1 Tax=Mus musculus TaxID=10090 RepID=A0A1W2P7G3_MOUSE
MTTTLVSATIFDLSEVLCKGNKMLNYSTPSWPHKCTFLSVSRTLFLFLIVTHLPQRVVAGLGVFLGGGVYFDFQNLLLPSPNPC